MESGERNLNLNNHFFHNGYSIGKIIRDSFDINWTSTYTQLQRDRHEQRDSNGHGPLTCQTPLSSTTKLSHNQSLFVFNKSVTNNNSNSGKICIK